MKQSGTINNEIIRYFNSLTVDDTDKDQKLLHHYPRKHVINNILNYARAMNVMQINNGQTFFLLNN
jgi:hypothetical protein